VTFAVIKAREELRAAALRVLSAEHLDHSGAHDAAEQEYADDQLAVAALHLTAAVAASDDPTDRPAAGWEPETLSDGFHTFAELYEHRHALACALARAIPGAAWRTRQHEEGAAPMYEGMFLLGIDLPTGPVSWHLPDGYWYLLDGVRELARAPHWDGYTPADVVGRLNRWRARTSPEAGFLGRSDWQPKSASHSVYSPSRHGQRPGGVMFPWVGDEHPDDATLAELAIRLNADAPTSPAEHLAAARREAAAAAVRTYVGGTQGWKIAEQIERGEVPA
jgi:hypothetical protein